MLLRKYWYASRGARGLEKWENNCVQGGGTKFKADLAGGTFHRLLLPGAVLCLLWKMQKMTSLKIPLQMFQIVNKQDTANLAFRNSKAKVLNWSVPFVIEKITSVPQLAFSLL